MDKWFVFLNPDNGNAYQDTESHTVKSFTKFIAFNASLVPFFSNDKLSGTEIVQIM